MFLGVRMSSASHLLSISVSNCLREFLSLWGRADKAGPLTAVPVTGPSVPHMFTSASYLQDVFSCYSPNPTRFSSEKGCRAFSYKKRKWSI